MVTDDAVPGGCMGLDGALGFLHEYGKHRRTAGGELADLWAVAFREPGDRVRWLSLGWLLGAGGAVSDGFYPALWRSPGQAARARSLALASDAVLRATVFDGLEVALESFRPQSSYHVPVRLWGVSCRRLESRRGGGLLRGWVAARLSGALVDSPRGAWRGLDRSDAGSIVRWFPAPDGCVMSAERLPF